ncbi:hypothetical protein MUJ63_04045 [Lachnospiraceae bacterium NSJ-143]|nr:hypothetical protein [Lachnospiraceae bacterium NSJ-143]
MTLIGLFSIFISFYAVYCCTFTGRKMYLSILIWSVPLIGMAYFTKSRSNINGIVVLISTLMSLASVYALYDTALWYKTEKGRRRYYCGAAVFVISLTVCMYYFYQCIVKGYLSFICGNILLKYTPVFTVLLGSLSAAVMVLLFFIAFDRYFSQPEKFVIIKCCAVRKNGIIKSRGIKGIQNGIEYYFNADRRTFFLLRNEKRIVMEVKRGVMGGIYVSARKLFKDSGRRKKRITKRLVRRSCVVILFIILAILLIIRLKSNMDFASIVLTLLRTVFGLR